MELGRLCDQNLTGEGTLDGAGGTWLNLAELASESDYIGTPARCPDCSDKSKSKFQLVLDEPRLMSMAVLLFHSASLAAKYRITVSTLGDTTYAAPTLQTGWEWVYPSLYDPEELEFGIENFISGTVGSNELGLYQRHMWAPFDEVVGERIRIEIDDEDHPDGFFDVGGLWVVSGWSPELNFARGRDLSATARDLVDEGPSGRLFAEERDPRRQLSLTYDALKDAEAYRWFDAGMRARTTRTVLFAPDVSDSGALMREAFPAVFGQLPAPRFTYPGLNTVAATLKEILA